LEAPSVIKVALAKLRYTKIRKERFIVIFYFPAVIKVLIMVYN